MNKSVLSFCGAALVFAAFAQEPAPAPEAKADQPAVKAERGPRQMRPRPQQSILTIDDKTTDEQVEAYKKEVAAKIDAAVAAYKAKPTEEGKDKAPTRVMLMVMDRPFGMGPNGHPGMGGRGMGRGMGQKGPRGPRGDRPARPDGDKAPEAAPEAK